MAQGGGKDKDKVNDALAIVDEIVKKQVKEEKNLAYGSVSSGLKNLLIANIGT
jgi:hypothetical protein